MLLVVALAGTLLAAHGCARKADVAKPDPGTITVIAGSAGVNLNPYTNVLSSRQIGALLFRGVLAVDDAGMPVPDLALEVPTVANGGMSEDRRVITYRLDPSAAWADGEPVTADDVVFTWGLLAAGSLVDDPRGTANVSSVVAADPHTVVLTLIEPDAPFAWRFVPYVLPEHLLSESADVTSDGFWYRPVGSRGRMVERYLKSTQVDIVDAEGVRPTIRVVFADSDEAARSVWESLEQGVWLQAPLGPTGAEQSDSVPGTRWQAFVMNASADRVTADLAVRQAFSQITTVTVTPGSAGPFGSAISDWTLEDTAIDSALQKAGWRRGSDGMRAKDGRPLTCAVLFNPLDSEEGDRIDSVLSLQRFGGDVEPYPTYAYTDFFGASPLVLGQFDVALMEFPIGVPLGWAWPFDSADIPSEAHPSGLNVARIQDSALDAAHDAMRNAGAPDELQRALASAWGRLEQQRYVHWDAQMDRTVLFKGLEGVTAQPVEEYSLRDVDEWKPLEAGSGE